MSTEEQLRVALAEREEWRERAVELRKQVTRALDGLAAAQLALEAQGRAFTDLAAGMVAHELTEGRKA